MMRVGRCRLPRAQHSVRTTLALLRYSTAAGKPPRISLTPDEEQIVGLLKDVNEHYNLGNTLRIAGGWVRNKLLGKPGGDIDIALDKMTGATFCKHLHDLQVERGLDQHRVAVIRANPAQSKHLETATTTVFNTMLDFVHLRSEVYDPDSRIPTVVFGTPKEDAERRDFTVNALYYSLNSGEVEDFTEKGLADLDAKLLRTPLEPHRTLLDDPLRALRCIRFVGQLGFEPVPLLRAALTHTDVQQALAAKVSRERVNVELTKMCLSPGAMRAFELLALTGLAKVVFDMDFNWKEALESLRRIGSLSLPVLDDENRECLILAAFLWPAFQQKRLTAQNIVDFFMLSLKGSKRRAELIALNLCAARAVIPLIDGPRPREEVASWIRAAPTHTWEAIVHLAGEGKHNDAVASLIANIQSLNPLAVRAVRPLMNGTELAKLLKLAPGPKRTKAALALMRWQLANPNAGRDEAAAWLMKQQF